MEFLISKLVLSIFEKIYIFKVGPIIEAQITYFLLVTLSHFFDLYIIHIHLCMAMRDTFIKKHHTTCLRKISFYFIYLFF